MNRKRERDEMTSAEMLATVFGCVLGFAIVAALLILFISNLHPSRPAQATLPWVAQTAS